MRRGREAERSGRGARSAPPEPAYWFPAKTYGWGWGPPRRWQGWVVLAVYFAMLGGGAFLMLPEAVVAYVALSFLLTAVVIGICWIKGERPRWGGKPR